MIENIFDLLIRKYESDNEILEFKKSIKYTLTVQLLKYNYDMIKLGDIIIYDNSGEVISREYFNIGNKILYTCSNNYINSNYDKFPKNKLTEEKDLILPRNGSQIPLVKIPIINSIYTNTV